MDSHPPLALQQCVFNDRYDAERDASEVLGQIRRAGYTAVESQLADPHRHAALLAGHGIRHAAVHLVPSVLASELDHWIRYAGITGFRDVCSSGLFDWNQRSPADHAHTARILNEAGKRLRDHGIHLHYHHHDFELLERVGDGPTSIEWFMEHLDPDACGFCFDVAWLLRGGVDPADFLARHADRATYLHFKDTAGTEWRELGRGTVDFAAIHAVLPRLTHVRWITVEQDKSDGDPAESIGISRAFLREQFGF